MYAHVGATSPMQTVPKQTLNLLEKDTVIPNDTKQWLQSSLNWEYMHSIWTNQYSDKASEQLHVTATAKSTEFLRLTSKTEFMHTCIVLNLSGKCCNVLLICIRRYIPLSHWSPWLIGVWVVLGVHSRPRPSACPVFVPFWLHFWSYLPKGSLLCSC